LIKLLGPPQLHGLRTVAISFEDAGVPLSSGCSYGIKLALMDDEACVFHSTTALAKT
jgi:hypothetical protein